MTRKTWSHGRLVDAGRRNVGVDPHRGGNGRRSTKFGFERLGFEPFGVLGVF